MKKGVDYIGVGIGAIIINDDGKFLLAKRGKKAKNERGKWEFPGGGVEFGERMRDSIVREIMEELNIVIEPLEHLPPIDHIIPQDKQHWVTSIFISRIIRGIPTIMEPGKCDEIGWFSIDEIKNLDLSIATQLNIPQIQNKKINK